MAQQSALYTILWACTSSWYYGFHLSELNFPVSSLTCTEPGNGLANLPQCLSIDTQRYGIVTAVYTVGGLFGSLGSSWLVENQGVKGGITWTGWFNVAGAIAMTFAPSWIVLALGRFLAGLSSGAAICLVPPFLSYIAKSSPQLRNRSGQIGTLHQMGIVIGLFTAQVAGMVLTGKRGDAPGKWRYVTALSGIVALIQVFLAAGVQSPSAEDQRRAQDAESAERLSPVQEADEGQSNSHLGHSASYCHIRCLTPRAENLTSDSALWPAGSSLLPSPSGSSQPERQLTLRELLSNAAFRGPTLLCASILCLQQLSGVNAVMFYSTPVLKPILPTAAGLIGLQITGVNALMTVVAIFLVDRLGRRPLLLASTAMMAICSALLAYGLDSSKNVLSAAAIILFIVGFSFGFGPIPFILVSELVPSPGIPALASLSLSLSWVANFFIAIFFLPLRDALSTPVNRSDPDSVRQGEGRIFYIFTVACALSFVIVWRGLGSKREA